MDIVEDLLILAVVGFLGSLAIGNWKHCSTQSQVVCNGVVQPSTVAAMQGCTNQTTSIFPSPSCLFSISL